MKKILLLLFSLFSAAVLFAQEDEEDIKRIEVTVDYDQIGYYDLLNVTYSYNGKDCKTYTVDFTDFEVVKGPIQRHFADLKKRNGKIKTEESYSFSYTLRPLSMGMMEVPSMIIKTDKRKTVKSKAFEVEVISGSIVKKPAPEVHKTLYNNSSEIVIGANNASGQYLFSTGPVYKTPDKNRMQKMDSAITAIYEETFLKILRKYTRCTKLGTWYWNDMPRTYFVAYDTAGILTSLKIAHENSGKVSGVVYSSHVFMSRNWNAVDEIMMLEGKEKLYGWIHDKSKAVLKQQAMVKDETFSVTVNFKSAEERETFLAKMHKEKCVVSNLSERTGVATINNGRFTVTLSKKVKPTEAAMMAFARKVEYAADADRGCVDACSISD